MTTINFLQVGDTIACGHCEPDEYGKGLANAENTIPDYECECTCHDDD